MPEFSFALRQSSTSSADRNDEQRRLIVYAYFRSGSTLAGQLFNYNPSSFYWYEPLAGVTKEFGWGGGKLQPRNYFHFDNGTEKYAQLRDLHVTLHKTYLEWPKYMTARLYARCTEVDADNSHGGNVLKKGKF